MVPADTVVTPKRKARRPLAPQAVDTPHNTAAAQSHAVAALDGLDPLTVQGIPTTSTRKRVLKLGK